MNIGIILAVAVALGVDAFSVSLAIGLCGVCTKSMMFRLSLIVASFHVIMPLIGLTVGESLGSILGRFAAFIGSLVLVALGGKMLWQGLHPKPWSCSLREAREKLFLNPLPEGVSLTGFGPYGLAAGVSLDALSVGFSLGIKGMNVPLTIGIMGITAGLMTSAGLILGKVVKTRIDIKAEILAGIVLLFIGATLFTK